MAIDAVAAAAASSTPPSRLDDASNKAALDYDSFLKLLIAQLKNQDPTDPMDPTDQMAQLASFSQVEQTIQTNKRLEMLMQISAFSQADSIIGRTITSSDGLTSGLVTEVRVNNDSITAVLDSGKELLVGPGIRIK